MDSTIIRFASDTIPNFIPDTTSTPLWQIGHSHKTFFGVDTLGTTTIMTDTINHYRKNANNWFIIKMSIGGAIIDFWHKYQTTSNHDGGLVEFSQDSGKTWQNVKGDCSTDGSDNPGILTTNFYSKTDTLLNGEPSFNGIYDSLRYSRLQFWFGEAINPYGSSRCLYGFPYLRFRFISDSISDTLAGWIIDSIKIEHDEYPGYVQNIGKQKLLNTYPNPSNNGTFNFPALNNEQSFSIEVYNAIGERILRTPYKQSLDIGSCAKGLYFYKVSDGLEYYSGRLLIE